MDKKSPAKHRTSSRFRVIGYLGRCKTGRTAAQIATGAGIGLSTAYSVLSLLEAGERLVRVGQTPAGASRFTVRFPG